MASKKDLVEAHSFNKRRLVTAFVSGAPGGREVEPVRTGRIVLGGAVLSVLLLAGAAVAGFLVGRPPAEWLDEGSFVISKDTGEQYVVLHVEGEPVIHQVPNYVSAQLLLEDADPRPHTVRDDYIRTVPLGDDLGIEGAPSGLPAPGDLNHGAWTSCTVGRAGVQVALRDEALATPTTVEAFMVRSGGRTWLIATAPDAAGGPGLAQRFAMPADGAATGAISDALGFGASPPRVDEAWLDLFPEGSPLAGAEFGIEGAGQPFVPADGSPALSRHRVGDLLVTGKGTADERHYLLAQGRPQQLSPFAALVYDATVSRAIPVAEVRSAFQDPGHPTEWPETLPVAAPDGPMCAVLRPSTDDEPHVALGRDPSAGADPVEVAKGTVAVDVSPSGGAYVLSDGPGGDREAYVVDARGHRFALVGEDVPGQIGYADVVPVRVPAGWLALFETGVALSTDAARRVAPQD